MKSYCSIPFDKELWSEISTDMDVNGKIILNCEDGCIYIMPVNQFNFMPDIGQVIEIVLDYSSQVAIGLITSWLYDRLAKRKIRTIYINGKKYDISDKQDLEDIVSGKKDEETE